MPEDMAPAVPAAPASSAEEAGAVHIRTYTEYCLSGQPNGDFPFYHRVAQAPEVFDTLFVIWEKIQSGQYAWTNVKLECRDVTVTHTPWRDISDMRITREADPL